MTLEKCLSALQIENAIDTFQTEWESSQASFPKSLPFLSADFLKQVVPKYFDDENILPTLLKAATHLRENEAALRLLWHQHYLVVQNYEKYWLKCYQFPELPVLGEDARAYYLLLALSGVYHFGDVHTKLKIPASDLKGTLEEIRNSVRGSVERKKLIGVAPHFSGWWQGFFSGRLYRLGRLSFLQEKYVWPFHVFENQKTKAIKILAGEGLSFNSKNLRVLGSEKTAWTSHFSQKNMTVKGSAIQPNGFAVNEMTELDLNEWTPIVRPNDDTLSVHIAAGEPMDVEACVQSFKRAKQFFARYFPEKTFKLFTCDTWLLDPQLKSFLSEKSNIVQFQRRFFLIPSAVDAEFVPIRTIFGAQALERGVDDIEASSSLQRGAKEFKQKGGVLRHGYGLIPFAREWEKETHV